MMPRKVLYFYVVNDGDFRRARLYGAMRLGVVTTLLLVVYLNIFHESLVDEYDKPIRIWYHTGVMIIYNILREFIYPKSKLERIVEDYRFKGRTPRDFRWNVVLFWVINIVLFLFSFIIY